MGLGATLAPFASDTFRIAFTKASTDTSWQCVTQNGGAATTVNSGVAPVAVTAQRFKIAIYDSTTPLGVQAGGPVVRFFINEQLVGVSAATGTAPLGSVLLMGWELKNTAGLGGAQRMYLGAIRRKGPPRQRPVVLRSSFNQPSVPTTRPQPAFTFVLIFTVATWARQGPP
jgi:hypothetical protein